MNRDRFCFLGNSHLGCLARALAESSALAADSYDIFASRGGDQPKVVYSDGRLLPEDDHVRDGFRTSSKGKTEIELDRYSVFIFASAGLHAVREEYPHPFKEVVLSSIAGKAHVPNYEIGTRTYISTDCARAVIHGSLLAHRSVHAIRDIAANSNAPIIVLPCPLPGESCFDAADSELTKNHGSFGKQIWTEWSRLHVETLAEVLRTLGRNVRLMPHPIDASQGTCCSKRAFEGVDPWHMNVSYGHLLLKSALDALNHI